ncbi:hypothetical protein [Paenibacillus sp. GCM10027626]|uniref:hypothetical protein n=1 Tax=Paenibacillus sp. GCM10027626 TaxID=3273411 RepID=UPI00363EBA94
MSTKFALCSARALVAALAVMLLITTGACSGRDKGMAAKSYGRDGYLGLSNSNPHLPNKHGNYLNYGSDGDFVIEKMKEINGVSDVNVMFQGVELYVTLTAQKGYDKQYLHQEALASLQKNMPRYNAHVEVTR